MPVCVFRIGKNNIVLFGHIIREKPRALFYQSVTLLYLTQKYNQSINASYEGKWDRKIDKKYIEYNGNIE